MRAAWLLSGILAAASVSCCPQAATTEDPAKLVREVVYNELQDHDHHGYFRYWIEQQRAGGTRLQEQVETADGPVARTLMNNGQRLDAKGEELEETRLRELKDSPADRASLRQSYRQDEDRLVRIVALLPDAFLYEDAGVEGGLRHLRFTPNPKYQAHGMEDRVFQHLSGDLWVDMRLKRIRLMEGRLKDDLDFGMGLLGRVNKGSWIRMRRTQVTADEWKMDRLDIHLSGRALLFKTIAHDRSEARGGFEAVPARMSLEQGLHVLEEPEAAGEVPRAGRNVPSTATIARATKPGS